MRARIWQRAFVSTRVEITTWQDCGPLLEALRHEVFVVGQGVPAELNLDGRDPFCVHAVAWSGPRVVGTGRLDGEGRVGRVAVLEEFRRRGIGRRIMDLLEAEAGGLDRVVLASQTHAVPFYERLGYVVVGEVFHEAGLPHLRMEKPLA